MNQQERFTGMLDEIQRLRAALIRMHKIVQTLDIEAALGKIVSGGLGTHEQSQELLAAIDESAVAISAQHKWLDDVLSPSPRFDTVDFFAGAIDAVDYISSVASGTTGAGVWESLCKQMRKGMVDDSTKKGFRIL